MLKFKEYQNILNEAAINKHMTHLEDSILILGSKGIIFVNSVMQDFLEKFSGSSTMKNTTTTVKFDGAPAIWAGHDPITGEFFVGTKSMFNASPKINYTESDVENNHKGGLADTLKVALKELKPIWPMGLILQGDVMFTNSTKNRETIDGDSYVTFQPNTLKYAVPASGNAAKDITSANFGIVFHTTYTGANLQNLSANFGADVSLIKKSKSAWVQNADYQITGEANFDSSEKSQFAKLLKASQSQSAAIDKGFIDDVMSNSQFNMMIQTHFNSRIRKGEIVTDPKAHMKDFYNWLELKQSKEIEKLKSVKGKEKKALTHKEINKIIKSKEKSLIMLFTYQKTVIDMKEMIITKLNKIKNISVFVEKTPGNYSVTNQEGFTAVDKLSGEAVKLVSRLEFSANNFNIPKNWK